MIENVKPIDALRIKDLQSFPIWQYTNREGCDETWVRPAKRIPAINLVGKVVGTQLLLANGESLWGIIGNIDPMNPRMTEHFLTLSVFSDDRWFGLARYHDFDFSERGPQALAQFLQLPVDSVFPIAYDIRGLVKGNADSLCGKILERPREKLTRSEIIAMAVP